MADQEGASPMDQNFLNYMQFFGKTWQICMLASLPGGSVPPPRILDPPLYIVKFLTRLPLSVQFSSFSCSFQENLAAKSVGVLPLGNPGSAPEYPKNRMFYFQSLQKSAILFVTNQNFSGFKQISANPVLSN